MVVPALFQTSHEELRHVQTVVCVDWLCLSEKVVKAIVNDRHYPLLVVKCLSRLPSQREHKLFQIVQHYFWLLKEFLVKRLVSLHVFVLLLPGVYLRSRLHSLRRIVFIVLKSKLVLHELKQWEFVRQQVRYFLQHPLVFRETLHAETKSKVVETCI